MSGVATWRWSLSCGCSGYCYGVGESSATKSVTLERCPLHELKSLSDTLADDPEPRTFTAANGTLVEDEIVG